MARNGTITGPPSGTAPNDAIPSMTPDKPTPLVPLTPRKGVAPLKDIMPERPDAIAPEASPHESTRNESGHDTFASTAARYNGGMSGLRDVDTPDLCDAVAQRAANLFATRQHLCAEAVLRALAEGLGGPLSPEQAAALGTPFCQGMGGAGCTCGALSGGIAGVGLYLGRRCDGASGAPGRRHARVLHDAFRRAFGATCCRVLTKNLDKAAHFAQCQHLTQEAARMAARLLLDEGVRPVNAQGLPRRPDTRLTAWRRRFTALFRRRA
ncbi:C-GCAxxG-C-C family protein [Nitratidesulfovibrio vulgaris]|nr:C-GCAxxG-C-C family protein [Nitratidesulfovibrio vulgaris]ADP87687.1 C_GCAxxG_C_C family protein [Nitratidesulfovibrio vulgaris RCH1]